MTASFIAARASLVAVLLLTAAQPLQAASAPAARVQAWLDSWSGLAGSFQQELFSPTLPAGQVEAGTFAISRPDRMRWDYTEPEAKLAMTDGRTTWLYLPEDRQVIVGRLETLRRDGAVALLLSGGLRLQEAFAIDQVVEEDGRIAMILLPASPSQTIEKIELVAGRDGAIRSFTVHDPSGNAVVWTLADLRLDPALPVEGFSFQVPPGVEVQDLDEMSPPSP